MSIVILSISESLANSVAHAIDSPLAKECPHTPTPVLLRMVWLASDAFSQPFWQKQVEARKSSLKSGSTLNGCIRLLDMASIGGEAHVAVVGTASSSTDRAGPSSLPPEDTAQGLVDVEEVPHVDFVVLYRSLAGVTYIVHKKTLERKALPVGDWLLEFDEDGFGFVVAAGDNEDHIMSVDDILEKRLCRQVDSGKLIVHKEGKGSTPSATWSWLSKAQEFEELEVNVRVGPAVAKVVTSW